MSKVEAHVPVEVLVADNVAAKLEFYTSIAKFGAVTGVGCVRHIGKRRYSLAEQGVRREVVVVVNRTGDPAVEESEIETGVELVNMLPSDVGIYKSRRCKAVNLSLASSAS